MTQRIKITSQSPYFDDYSPAKDYVRVLFRPGYPVQARELSTLQTMTQEQLARLGDKILNNGNITEGGELDIVNTAKRLVMTGSGNVTFNSAGAPATYQLATIDQLEGLIISNPTGTVKAKVLSQPSATASQIGNLFISYITETVFESNGGYIYATTEDNPDLATPYWNSFSSYTPACIANIKEGLFYVKGMFVRIANQTVLIDSSSNTPSVQIGFTANESIVTQNEDSTLYDNARGTTNEGAPGAHRLKIELGFATKSLNTEPDSTFYHIATIVNGVREEQNYVSQEYGDLIDIMARRTYDESGNYALKPFTPSLEIGSAAGTFNINIGPSKAYVQGYEIDKRNPTVLPVPVSSASERFKNYGVPFVGTTSLDVTAVTNSLPGQSGGNPYSSANRLLLRDAANNVIGIARGYAINDEFDKGAAKTRLYLYDVKMFQVLVVDNNPTFVEGNDVYSLRTRGYIYTTDGSAGITNGVTIVSSNGKFRAGQTINSDIQSIAETITSVTQFSLAEVDNITDATATFSCSVAAGTVANSTSTLYTQLPYHVKTMKESGIVMDNDYQVIEDTGAATTNLNSSNGQWDSVRYDDNDEIEKQINFCYLKVTNATARTGINYGWVARDKEISLYYPDGQEVYGVNQTSANTFATGRFTQIEITTSGNIPQGSVISGSTSGTKAVVALSNTSNTGATQLSNNALYHMVETGTGSIGTLEVIFKRGNGFTEGETLTVEVPGGQTEFTNSVTYVSISQTATGKDVKSMFRFDNGQRNEFYDIARLTRKEDTFAPTNDLVIFFSYFTGDTTSSQYYNVDSYNNLSFYGVDVRHNVEPIEILPKKNDSGIDLRNVVDFRLKVQPSNDVVTSPFNFSTRAFENQSRILPKSKLTTDFDVYVGRISKVTLDSKGSMLLENGLPSLTPERPLPSQNNMDLFYLSIPPAVRYISEITVERLDNRRYTMRDIGQLDKRIGRLEKSVALSLLESQALHDDVSTRTKSGFVVDDFTSIAGSPADQSHTEFNASFDTASGQLLPAQTTGVPVRMEFGTMTNVSSFFTDFVIKDFEEEVMVEQINATKTSKIVIVDEVGATQEYVDNAIGATQEYVDNAIANIPANTTEIYHYVGNLTITPDEDHWHERTDSYFTKQYGELQPFAGSPAEFKKYVKVVETKVEGFSGTEQSWTGREPDLEAGSMDLRGMATAFAGGYSQAPTDAYGYSFTVAAKKQTTTTTKKTTLPGEITTTLDGSKVIEDPEKYYVRPVQISWSVVGVKPTTDHHIYINGKQLSTTAYTTNDEGEASGTFRIPGSTYKAGSLSIELRAADVNSFAQATFKSVGHIDSYVNVKEFADAPVITEVQPAVEVATQPTIQPPAQWRGAAVPDSQIGSSRNQFSFSEK